MLASLQYSGTERRGRVFGDVPGEHGATLLRLGHLLDVVRLGLERLEAQSDESEWETVVSAPMARRSHMARTLGESEVVFC